MAETVMVISPFDTFRTTLEALIQHAGHAICPGIRSLEGFRHALNACKTPPTVILLDFWLSQPVTLSFIQGLKQQGFTVILMGTNFFGRDVAAIERISFLEKPFTSQEVLKIINTVNR